MRRYQSLLGLLRAATDGYADATGDMSLASSLNSILARALQDTADSLRRLDLALHPATAGGLGWVPLETLQILDPAWSESCSGLLTSALEYLDDPRQADPLGLHSIAGHIDDHTQRLLLTYRDWAYSDLHGRDEANAVEMARFAEEALEEVQLQIATRRSRVDQVREYEEFGVLLLEQRQATTKSADLELTKAYEDYRRQQSFAANFFRFLTIAALVSAAGSALLGLDRAQTTGAAISHGAVALAFLALGGYFGREAGQHRVLEQWAAVMVVQLKTFDAYTGGMAPESRDALRADFGRRVFSEIPGTASDFTHADQLGSAVQTLAE